MLYRQNHPTLLKIHYILDWFLMGWEGAPGARKAVPLRVIVDAYNDVAFLDYAIYSMRKLCKRWLIAYAQVCATFYQFYHFSAFNARCIPGQGQRTSG